MTAAASRSMVRSAQMLRSFSAAARNSAAEQAVQRLVAASSSAAFSEIRNPVQVPRILSERAIGFTYNQTNKRCKTTYSANLTVSMERCDSLALEDHVIHHAYLRVQILFFVFAAYWKERCLVSRPLTMHQHGKSKILGMCAAHSSILPNVSDNYFDLLIESLRSKGITSEVEEKLIILGVSKAKIHTAKERSLTEESISELLSHIPENQRGRIFCDQSGLYQAMNSTVELPVEVNQFDFIIEQKRAMRGQAIALVNRVSRGEIDPYEATKKFVSDMHDFFHDAQMEVQMKMSHIRQCSQAQKSLKNLENQVVTGVSNQAEWLKKYLNAFAQIHYHSNKIAVLNAYSPKVNMDCLLPAHMDILSYIENLRVKNYRYASQIKQKKVLEGYIRELIKKMSGDTQCANEELLTLQSSLKSSNFNCMRTAILKFWSHIDEMQLLFQDPKQIETFYHYVEGQIFSMPGWNPIIIEQMLSKLDQTLSIIEWQSRGTAAPGLSELLSLSSESAKDLSIEEKYSALKMNIIRPIK